MTEQRPRFLTADWRHLAMLNFEINPAIVEPYVPAGTVLDAWNGRYYVSMVAFMFLNTRVMGVPIPFHRNFEEINLRFYVRREADEGIRRGVVFVKEIVPRRAIAFVARTVYHENYVAMPTRHDLKFDGDVPWDASYGWRYKGNWNGIDLKTDGDSILPSAGSEEEFITEHYWGYAAQPDGSTVEYEVEHPPWRVWTARERRLTCDVEALYGKEFAGTLSQEPTSAFLAEGSAVTVRRGVRIKRA